MSGFSVLSGGISNLADILARMTANNSENEKELGSKEEFAQYIKYPNTVDAVLIDPFDKTWHKVTLPLEIEVENDEDDEVCQCFILVMLLHVCTGMHVCMYACRTKPIPSSTLVPRASRSN